MIIKRLLYGFFMMKIFVCYASEVAKLSIGGVHHSAEDKCVRDQELQPWNCTGVRRSLSPSQQQLKEIKIHNFVVGM